jgi:hypothetical protein
MIHESEILTEVEQILANHWTYSILPREHRAIRAVQRLEAQLGTPAESGVTWVDIAIIVLACVLLVVVKRGLM